MISEYFKDINNMSILPIISMVLFFIIFIASVVWAITRKKNYLVHMGNLPLETETENENNSEMKNEIN